MMKLVIALCLIGFTAARIVPVYYEIHPEDVAFETAETEDVSFEDTEAEPQQLVPMELVHEGIRERRSLQPGAPSFPMPGSQLPGSFGANIEKEGRNTIATINAQHKTDRHDIRGTWTKVIRGPGRSKPNFNIGGSYRW